MSTQTFLPIRLRMPDPQEWDRVRSQATDPETPIEIVYGLSSKPQSLWVYLFQKAWRLWYESRETPLIMSKTLIITCRVSELPMYREMVTVIIEEANQKSAPLIRGQVAQAALAKVRNEKIGQLELEQAKPVTLPNTRDGDTLADIYRHKLHNDRQKLLREIALAELDAALAEMSDAELVDVMNRVSNDRKRA